MGRNGTSSNSSCGSGGCVYVVFILCPSMRSCSLGCTLRGLVVRTWCFHCRGLGSASGLGSDPTSNLMWPKIVTKDNPSSSMGSSTPKTLKYSLTFMICVYGFSKSSTGGMVLTKKATGMERTMECLKVSLIENF